MLGTNGASFTALSPNKCHLLVRYRKTIKKELSPGLRTQTGKGRWKGKGARDGGKGEGAASCAIVNSRENATKAENADEVAAIKRCHTM